MPLEATVICLDTSSFQRNGDYAPTRFDAQRDAVNIIASAKTQQNPESTVALLKAAGGCQTLSTLTTDVGRILSVMHRVQLNGSLEFCRSLQVAALCLKHRQNKNQRQRIVAFVGSPLDDSEADMVKLAKKLKKNSVAVDVVNFGEDSASNADKLEAFIAAVNSSESCHLLTVPPGPHHLADLVMSSPIVVGEGSDGAAASSGAGAGAGGAGGGGGFAEFGGVDPNMDPELALALRLSMEEERARAAQGGDAGGGAAATASSGAATSGAPAQSPAQTTTTTAQPAAFGPADMDADDDDLAAALALSNQTPSAATPATSTNTADTASSATRAADDGDDDDELAAALAMSVAKPTQSMAVDNAPTGSSTTGTGATATTAADDDDDLAAALAMSVAPREAVADTATRADVDDDDDELAAALALSVSKPAASAAPQSSSSSTTTPASGPARAQETEVDPVSDAAFLQSVLATLPGVDPNDPQIQAILEQFKQQQQQQKK